MSTCGGNTPCGVNPCDCVETAAIREQGGPGPMGAPGGTPVFQIGSVASGATPQVTLEKINPLLYTLNFVIPSSGTNIANTWTAVQTFVPQAVFQNGISAAGASLITDLTLNGPFVVQDIGTYLGSQSFQSLANFNGGIFAQNGITTDTIDVTGAASFPGATPLSATECIKGQAYIDGCGRLRYISGGFPNSANASGAFSTTITPGTAETPLPINVPFTIPSSCECGAATSRDITVRGIVEFEPAAQVAWTQGTSPPYQVTAGTVKLSLYALQIRLDNPVTGPLIYSSKVSNLDAARNFLLVQSSVPAGAHTLYITLVGLGGSNAQNITAVGLSATVEF